MWAVVPINPACPARGDHRQAPLTAEQGHGIARGLQQLVDEGASAARGRLFGPSRCLGTGLRESQGAAVCAARYASEEPGGDANGDAGRRPIRRRGVGDPAPTQRTRRMKNWSSFLRRV